MVDTGKDAAWLLGENKRDEDESMSGRTQAFTRDGMPTSNQDYDGRMKWCVALPRSRPCYSGGCQSL